MSCPSVASGQKKNFPGPKINKKSPPSSGDQAWICYRRRHSGVDGQKDKTGNADYQRAIVLPLCAPALSRPHRAATGVGALALAAPGVSSSESLLLKQPMVLTTDSYKNVYGGNAGPALQELVF
jgi:hypothetical protein